MPKYISVHSCVSCSRVLSNDERWYSDGVCPHCGYVAKGSICDTNKTSELKIGAARGIKEWISDMWRTILQP